MGKNWKEEAAKRRLQIESVEMIDSGYRVLVKCFEETGVRKYKIFDIEQEAVISQLTYPCTTLVAGIKGVNQVKFNKNFFSIRHTDDPQLSSQLIQTHFDGAHWLSQPVKDCGNATSFQIWTTNLSKDGRSKFNLIVGFKDGSLQILIGLKNHHPTGPVEFIK